jgi:hypothetical protein
MKTNIKLIQTFVDTDLIRYYAVFMKLKSLHSNSRIYNTSAYNIAKQSGLSRTAVVKYMSFFKENGWTKETFTGVVFIGHKKLKSLYSIKLRHDISIKKEDSVSAIVSSLRYEIFKHKQTQFNYIKSASSNLINPSGKNAIAKYKKARKVLPNCKSEVLGNLKISVKKLGLLIGKSASTASNLIKEKGAQVFRNKIVLDKSKNIKVPYGFYWCGGKIIKVECNSYIF